ncbi:ABC transporter ATP-binding protein [Cytobacillus sp. FJAT-53684]|uniref:ABC transporter ATP-binding protein n=1 Tax=Cytobacillus mangrovibacter TaxID=3299024 RepID=A0ABW6JZ00_9BACI
MKQLIVDGISKEFKGKIALHKCSFTATPGSCVVLCGGNGAGKSTMINIIAGISLLKQGSVTFGETNLALKPKEYLGQIGYMPDDYHAQGTLSVREFLMFYASIRRISKERVAEVMNIIGLTEQSSTLVKSLSKGMKQRLLFGQSILSDPPLLIMDEPTNGLDPYWVDRFIEILKNLRQNGTIILFSTHMMDVAAEIGTDIIFMKQGKIIEVLNSSHSMQDNITRLMQLHRC